MENNAKGKLVLGTIVGIIGIVVTIISIIVTVIAIRQASRKDEHQKSNRRRPKS